MVQSLSFSQPSLARINTSVPSDSQIRSADSVTPLWDFYFEKYYRFVKHRDVADQGEANYFFREFKHKYETFVQTVLIAENKEYFDPSNGRIIDTNRAAVDWAAFLLTDEHFLQRTQNALVWAFEILKTVVQVLEDLVITKGNKVKLPTEAIKQASKLLRDDARARFLLPKEVTQADLAGINLLAFSDPNWPVTHANNAVKVFRDNIRTNRELVQKKLGAIAKEGNTINSAIIDTSTLLRAIIKLNNDLVKRLIPKG